MSDVQTFSVDPEIMEAAVAGFDLSFLKGLLPNIDAKKALAALLNSGVPGVVAYLQEEAAKTPNPLDDLAVKYIGQALTAWIAQLLKGATPAPIPGPGPMVVGDAAEAVEVEGKSRRQQIEDYVRARGGDPVKLNPIFIQILLILAWPIVEKLLEKWLRS